MYDIYLFVCFSGCGRGRPERIPPGARFAERVRQTNTPLSERQPRAQRDVWRGTGADHRRGELSCANRCR